MLYSSLKNIIKRAAESSRPFLRTLFGEKGAFLFIAALVGALAGFGAYVLKTFIGAVSQFLTGGTMDVSHANWGLIVLPVAGVVLTGIFTRYILKTPLEHGCERIDRDIKAGQYRLSPKIAIGNIIAATLSLGFGGSAGSEGPIAYTGAALGSNVGRAFGLNNDQLRLLIGIGAGAGIAGIFKAPVGGMLFTLEVMALEMGTFSVIGLAVACLTAAAVATACSGYTLDVPYHHSAPFSTEMMVPLLILGLFCGLYSLWYSFCMSRSQPLINRIANPWVRNIVSGAFIGLCLFFFPTLYGEGYGVVEQLINGQFADVLNDSMFYGGNVRVLMFVVAGTLIVKGLVVQTTNSGGGVAGDFAPTLFAGALCGFLFATFCNTVLGTHICVADFAFFGMAAVMAGCIQAPLMALFLTAEMTGDFAMFLPLMISAAISYGMVRFCYKRSHAFRPVWHNFIRHI